MGGPRVERRYRYVDEAGKPLYEVERLVPKGFRQRRWVGPLDTGEWVYNMDGVRRVLYRLPEVLQAIADGRWIFVCEGEKDADNVCETGRVATTAPMGAGKWRPEYTEALRGARVALISDNDFEGARHVLKVAVELDGVVAELRTYQPPPGFKDPSDQLKKDGKLRLVPFDRAAAQAQLGTVNGNGNGHRKLKVTSVRDFCAQPAPDRDQQLLGPLLWRSGRHAIGAWTGEGKTTMSCNIARAMVCKEPFLRDEWKGAGGRVLYVNLEQGNELTKRRLREVGLDKLDGVDLIHEPDGLSLDRNPDDVRQVEGILKDGRYDLVVWDPFYQLHEGDSSDEVEAKRMARLIDGWARRFEFASLVPMHCRKKPSGPWNHKHFSKDDIAGLGVWTRNADVILGLQSISSGLSWLHFFKDRAGMLDAVNTYWPLTFDVETHLYHRGAQPTKAARDRVGGVLQTNPGLTTEEVASLLDVMIGTASAALRERGAFPDDKSKPLAERRWRLEEWPSAQLTIEEAGFNGSS